MKLLQSLSVFAVMIASMLSWQSAHGAVVVSGSATVDGYFSEWNLATDFYADMFRSGDPGKQIESKLYLRYDIAGDILYSLVLSNSANIYASTSDPWLKIYDIGNSTLVNSSSVLDGTPPDFAWIPDPLGTSDKLGYEASISGLSTHENFPSFVKFEAHVNVWGEEGDEGETSSTGKKNDGCISLELPNTTPEVPEPSTFIVWSLFGLFGVTFGCSRARRAN